MNTFSSSLRRRLVAGALAGLAGASAWGAPGAHGPDGEHLDAPGLAAAGTAHPRLEAASELFELVAELKDGELAVLVDRYETNEPVLGARLEIESGEHQALATFRPDRGDYAVAPGPLVDALARPGEHALVFTLTAGDTADLLDGTLVMGSGGTHDHGEGGHLHDGGLERALWTGAAVLLLAAVGAGAWWRQRRAAASLNGGRA